MDDLTERTEALDAWDYADAGRAAHPLAGGQDTYIPGCTGATTGDGRGRLTAELRWGHAWQ